jgi:hypothetical protein
MHTCTIIISLTECNTGTTQKLQFVFKTAIELISITTTSGNTNTLPSQNIAC